MSHLKEIADEKNKVILSQKLERELRTLGIIIRDADGFLREPDAIITDLRVAMVVFGMVQHSIGANCAKRSMSAAEFLRQTERIEFIYSDARDPFLDAVRNGEFEKAVAIVEAWAREHPERSEE